MEEFLQTHRMVLSGDAKAAFLDTLEGKFIAALATLRRRAGGDYRQDRRPEKFPAVDPSTTIPSNVKPSGLTAWGAFQLWIEERKPAASSVNRWRAVFSALRETFGDRDLVTITPEEVQEWIEGLTTEDRSAHVVNDVWLRAARTVVQWAVTRKRLPSNPFSGATVALPRRAPKLREREFHDEEWRTVLRATLQPPPPRMEPTTPQPAAGSLGCVPIRAQDRVRLANSERRMSPYTLRASGSSTSLQRQEPLREGQPVSCPCTNT